MSRNVVNEMKKIFNILAEQIDDENRDRILDRERHIVAKGNEDIVIEFVKFAGKCKLECQGFSVMLFCYKDENYLLAPKSFENILESLGLEQLLDFREEDDHNSGDACEIIQGCQMLAITGFALPVKKSLSQLELIDKCLGIEEDTYGFQELAENFFEESCVFKIAQNRFAIKCIEDLQRLICYCLAHEQQYFTENTVEVIKAISLLESSRAISATVLNGIVSPVAEYTFLQLYQCIEYLFRLCNSFDINKKYAVTSANAIDLVSEYEFKLSERDNLRKVLANNAEEKDLDNFLLISNIAITEGQTKGQKCDCVTDHIYKIRCNIAHLRYGQDTFLKDIKWSELIEAVAVLILTIYQKLDKDIVNVYDAKKTWDEIEFIHNK